MVLSRWIIIEKTWQKNTKNTGLHMVAGHGAFSGIIFLPWKRQKIGFIGRETKPMTWRFVSSFSFRWAYKPPWKTNNTRTRSLWGPFFGTWQKAPSFLFRLWQKRRMVRCQTPVFFDRRDSARQFSWGKTVPVLPFRNDQKKRKKERRNTEISLPFLRKRIQSADRKPFRFQKDSSGRMDRIPCPSFSVRKPQRIFSRQQKCTFDWAILDKKGLWGAETLSGRNNAWQRILDWRDLRQEETGRCG